MPNALPRAKQCEQQAAIPSTGKHTEAPQEVWAAVNTPSSGYVPPYRRATIKGHFPADRSSRAPSVANSCVEIAEPTHLGKLMPRDLEPTYGRSHDEKTKEPTGFPHSPPCHLNSEHSTLHANQNQCSSESNAPQAAFFTRTCGTPTFQITGVRPLSIPYWSVLHWVFHSSFSHASIFGYDHLQGC